MKFDGPAGQSSHAEKTREPLQLMVHAQTDLAGQFPAGFGLVCWEFNVSLSQ